MIARLAILVTVICSSVTAQADTITIGLRAHNGEQQAMEQWQPTADYLSGKLAPHKFVMKPYIKLDELMEAARLGKFDFVLTNPTSSIEMEMRFGASQLVTLKNRRQGRPYTHFGAVIFTRADNTEISNIADLRGKKMIAVSERAFGGWRVAWRELLRHDFNPHADLGSLDYADGIQSKVVYSVLNGSHDAGVVRTDMLERMAAQGEIALDKVKVINARHVEGFPFFLSTDLYPEWPFSKMSGAPNNLAQQVALALLTMPETDAAAVAGNYVGWTVVEDYKPVHDLMKDLNIGPYRDMQSFDVRSFFKNYFAAIVVALAGAAMLMLAMIYIVIINRRLQSQKSKQAAANFMLVERVKELNCLYKTSDILSRSSLVESAFMEIVDIIPASFQYPDLTSARIVYKDRTLKSSPFVESPSRLTASINEAGIEAGKLEVFCAEEAQQHDHGPFLEEETALVNEIAHRLSQFLDRTRAIKLLQDTNADLELRVIERTRELIEARDIAEKANSAKTDFLSRMSHELRTPLNAILGFSELLRMNDKITVDEDVAENIAEIEVSGRMLLEFVNDVLDLSRIESGRYEISITRFNVAEAVTHCLEMVQDIAAEKCIKVDADVAEDLALNTDRRALIHIMFNLLSNAIKYNYRDGDVHVSAFSAGAGTVKFIVQDSGRGISEDQLGMVFSPFERVGGGIGVGLSVARELAGILSGSIGIESSDGRGTRVEVLLPNMALAEVTPISG